MQCNINKFTRVTMDNKETTVDEVASETKEIKTICDWCLSIFGRMNFGPTFVSMSDGKKGFVMTEMTHQDALKLKRDITISNSAKPIVDGLTFLNMDSDKVQAILGVLVDSDDFLFEVNDPAKYVVVIRIQESSAESYTSDIDQCVRWASVVI